jgi:hypothetical protein
MLKKYRLRLITLAVIACAYLLLLFGYFAQAAQLTDRSIQISTAQPSVISNHTFWFTYVSTTTIGSVVFEYCDSPVFDYPCNPPAGLNVSSAILTSQSGNSGFSFDGLNSTANKIVITRPPSAAAAIPSMYAFNNITNPSTNGMSIFVRISTHSSTDGSGPITDKGAVAFTTQSPFTIGADVPPFLQICVAVTVAVDCSQANGDRINLGNLSNNTTKFATSQFAIGTNSITGYIVFILGTTLTSGNNSIAALALPTNSIIGNSQFGINLRDNSIPDVGADPAGTGTGSPTASYNTPNLYKFTDGEAIATSSLPTNYNRMTVSYVVNVNKSQPPGIYSATFTYLASANF